MGRSVGILPMTRQHVRTPNPMKRRNAGRRLLGGSIVLALVGGLFVGQQLTPAPAQALNLPTWNDVQAAKSNQAATAKKVSEIKALIKQNEEQLKTLEQQSSDASAAAQEAQDELTAVDQKLSGLEEQTKASQKQAKETSAQAAGLVSQMYRSGGVDRNVELFLDPNAESADNLLDRMAMMTKVAERNTSISNEAMQAANTAAALSEQTAEAKAERERLYKDAETKSVQAAKAVDDMRGKQLQAEENQRTLSAQLAALEDKTAKTVAGYQERLRIEEEQRRKREEAARKAAAEAARKAAAEAAARQRAYEAARKRAAEQGRPAPTPPPAAGGGGGSAPVSGGAWGRPLAAYRISCPWGCYPGHQGTDLAIGQGTPIYAAASGTVAYSGFDSIGGYNARINHGGGITSYYGHMVRLPSVSYGQRVHKGQIIGYVGATGLATGPHVHFGIMRYGGWINAQPFMASVGAPL